jgi:hypothetical protein
MRKKAPKATKKSTQNNRKVKVRGTGAAKKGLYARGPMA